ncbi:endolytic transglycosylase MltG [Deinococcus sp.]|uniref:endolytic transglycosylase MltG n=1 Tax=Deinococcus sp. TaxID=47478 RepID=UPI003C7BE82E
MTLPNLTPLPPTPPPTSRRRWRPQQTLLLVSLALLLVTLALLGYAASLTRAPAPATGRPYTLEVRAGDTLPVAAARLQRAGVIRSSDVLRLIMRQRGTAGRLREGYYDLPPGLDAFHVADRLADTPRPRVRSVTIPEGKRLKDLPALLEAARLGDPASFASSLKADSGRCPGGSLEGFLFPATYPFRPEASNAEIVKALRARMTREFTPERVQRARRLGLDVCGWVTLASMVQAEAASVSEMPTIAGIFLNRLKAGIALGADPTVAYGLGKDLNQLDRHAGDFTRDTPYNTYTRRGLPPGPINNPGEAALKSVLNARRTTESGKEALYFVHGLDGKIHVNADYASHLRDVNRYR